MKKCKRDNEGTTIGRKPRLSQSKSVPYDGKVTTVPSKPYSSKKSLERTTSIDEKTQIALSEMTDKLRNTKVRDSVTSRVQTTAKRPGRRNTPVPLPAGKTNFRHTSFVPRGKAPRPPDIIEGRGLMDKSSAPPAKKEPRPMRTRAYSDSSWRDMDTVRASTREHGLMLKKTGAKSSLPPMGSGLSYGRRGFPGNVEKLRPLSMPTAELGSSKISAARQSVNDKDLKGRGLKGKGIVRRSKTLGDLNSKLTPVQGVKPPLKPKLTHKSSKQKRVETNFDPNVPTEPSITMTSSDSTASMSSMQSDDSSKCQLDYACVVPSISLDAICKLDNNNSGGHCSVYVSETVEPFGKQQALNTIQINDEDPDSLPALPVINLRPATPLPKEGDNKEEETVATFGKLLRKTVCQAAIRQKELEELFGDIEEYSAMNSNLQSQVNIVEG